MTMKTKEPITMRTIRVRHRRVPGYDGGVVVHYLTVTTNLRTVELRTDQYTDNLLVNNKPLPRCLREKMTTEEWFEYLTGMTPADAEKVYNRNHRSDPIGELIPWGLRSL